MEPTRALPYALYVAQRWRGAMRLRPIHVMALAVPLVCAACQAPVPEAVATTAVTAPDPDATACAALLELPNLTVTMAKIVESKGNTPRYCYVRGAIPPG